MANALSTITSSKDSFFFEKKQISPVSFNPNADIAVTVPFKNSLFILNQGPGVIKVSFNGTTDQLVLAVQKIGNGNDSFVGAISWTEFI
jgi:hypothetical protein